ncbi:unnamed protein product [Linum tenue]|uniref:RNase H type-1 domain-containing protein n=1 Tax=Linum tenue TaxID=586396 RepID=A0AAV0RG31_9ROSI|nr:unnamed protein product [Linum tenue]
MARVLKARYFPRCDILNAKIGNNPSYIWRSLVKPKDEIVDGFRWRVGDGESIKVWDDWWIPNTRKLLPVQQDNEIRDNLRVSSLIDRDNGWWDIPKLRALFFANDQTEIMKIPLRNPPTNDIVVWSEADNGIYSVKTAYRSLWQNEHPSVDEDNSESQRLKSYWRKIWRLPVQPKVKIFLWRISRDILPVGTNVESRIEEAPSDCPFCGLPETQLHCLRDCDWTRRLWQPCSDNGIFKQGEGFSGRDWFLNSFESHSNENLQRFCAILWFIWKERCNHMFNNKKLEAEEIIPKALDWLSDYLQAQGTVSANMNHPSNPQGWRPPPSGSFKMNSDAGVLRLNGIGLGCVLRDWNENFLGAVAGKESGTCRPVEAEARALVAGLREANRRGWSALIVESDCMKLIQMLDKGEEDRTELEIWCKEIRELASINEAFSGKKVEWAFVPRKSNAVAHCLAHLDGSWDQICIWTDSPPYSIRSLLEAEKAQFV